MVQNVEKLEHVFFGYDCVADVCAPVFEDEARVREQEWFIAHFGSGFDFLPILQWLYKQQRFLPKILLRGNKVISMRVGNRRFIDSYLFIPIPLANFTKTFGPKELRRGFFPHCLTSPEALAEPPSALHSTCDCKATNGRHLKYQFSQDCYHCTEERPKKKSALPGKARSATFSFLPGEFPPPCLFGINSLKNGKNFEDFTLWHSLQRKNYEATSSVYNFKQELIEYCRSDVTLLREGVSEFRRLIRMSCQNIDPFQVACTAASACNYIYRQLFMPENSIGILPNNGYRCLDKTSFPACLWLEWVERRERKYGKEQRQSIEVFKSGIISNDKAKEGEQRLGPCKVDGFLVYEDDQTSSGNFHRAKVLEFLGCYHHGCPQCYPDRLEVSKKRKMSMGDLHLVSVEERLSWLKKQKELKTIFTTSNGLNIFVEDIETIWECQFSKLLEKGDNELNEHQSDLEMLKKSFFNFTPLKARDAFVGGRTENFKSFWHKNCLNQKFHYIDVCSLYPYVNSTCDYPVGHPDEVLIAPIFDEKKDSQLSLEKRKLSPVCDRDDSIYSLPQTAVESKILNEQFFGLIKCLVLPPRNLLIPVLPLKFASNLFFPLCKTCVDMKHTKTFEKLFLGAECEHDDYQMRMFWGTFVTKELRLSLLKGYRIVDVSEVWSWKEEKRSKELFKRYINTFLKLKLEASGWPHCDCEVEIVD